MVKNRNFIQVQMSNLIDLDDAIIYNARVFSHECCENEFFNLHILNFTNKASTI